MFVFFSPGKVIEKYYFYYLVNLHNSSSEKSVQLRQKIESLRKLSSQYYCWDKKGLICFQPNVFYVEKIIFNYLLEENKLDFLIVTDQIDNYHYLWKKIISTNFTEENLNNHHQEMMNSENLLLWITNLSLENLKIFKKIQTIKSQHKNCVVYLSLDYFLYEDMSEIIEILDFFTFNPTFSLDVDGVVLFGFANLHKIQPVYLGSNSVTQVIKKEYCLSKSPYCFECGTLNLPVLLLLEKYFYYLVNEKQKILQIISNIKTKNCSIFRNYPADVKYLHNFNFWAVDDLKH